MESRVRSKVVLQVQGVVLYVMIAWFQDPSTSELGRGTKKINPSGKKLRHRNKRMQYGISWFQPSGERTQSRPAHLGLLTQWEMALKSNAHI
ncbi:HET domain-containing protein [Fusarium oxysporum f. sp. albedinis]|nr:HET domain-containing protein [Fusarium oxysporum f. sp. albedinis]